MSTIVHLVRHGEVDNPRKVRYGRLSGYFLSERGKQQAREAGAYLATLSPRPARLISSPLERAVQTAQLVWAQVMPAGSIDVDARLIEATSVFDGLPRKAPVRDIWRALRDPARDAKSEPGGEVAARMRDALIEAARSVGEGQSAVLVSHQAPIGYCRAAMMHNLGTELAPGLVRLAPWAFRGIPCSYASITSFDLARDGRAKLLGYWAP